MVKETKMADQLGRPFLFLINSLILCPMTPIEEIQAWLQKPRYQAGVELYAKLSSSSAFLQQLFAKGYDDYNQKRLHKELSATLSALLKAQEVTYERYPLELKQDLLSGKQLMDIRQALKEQCRTLIESAAGSGGAMPNLKEQAFRILDIGDELTVIYGKKRFVDKNGYLPEPATNDGDTREELLLRRNTVRTYVSRLSRQLVKVFDDDKRDSIETRLATFRSELHQIETKLKQEPTSE
jgi:hypothetical protein